MKQTMSPVVQEVASDAARNELKEESPNDGATVGKSCSTISIPVYHMATNGRKPKTLNKAVGCMIDQGTRPRSRSITLKMQQPVNCTVCAISMKKSGDRNKRTS